MSNVPDAYQALADQFADEAAAFLAQHPDLERIEILLPDINGILRGKWLTGDALAKLASGDIKLPRSIYFMDVWGSDVPEVGLAQEVGDPDGVCLPVLGSLAIVPWSYQKSAQVLMQMIDPDTGRLTAYDPRQVLNAQIEKLAEHDLYPVVATELEFYLVSMEATVSGHAQPATLSSGFVLDQAQTYDMQVLDQIEPIVKAINDTAHAQHIPVDTTIAEVGPGQFEINLLHQADPLLAADHTVLLKRIIKRVLHQYDLLATFMAKPYGDEVGSGMHVHVSLVDVKGQNVFSAATSMMEEEISSELLINDLLSAALGGLIQTAPAAQAIFAPHANSYRRFQPHTFAPVTPCWGLDHRGAALRVPEWRGVNARLEHRLSGSDANPYLVIALILAGIRYGIEHDIAPGAPIPMDADLSLCPSLSTDWAQALRLFAEDDFVRETLGEEYQRVFVACKQSEINQFGQTVTDFESQTYLQRL